MPVEWDGDAVKAKVRQGAMRGVIRGTEAVLEEGTSLILEGPKTGRVYRRRGVVHQASAPGEPPASDTGRLVRSGRTEFDIPDLSGVVTWSTAYALPLEVGTENMEPRPYARPALANKKDEVEQDVADGIADALK